MLLLPSITIKNQSSVRLIHTEEEGFDADLSDPVAQAWYFAEKGYKWLNVIDQNARLGDRDMNRKVISNIIKTVNVSVQIGGGANSIEDIKEWIDMGAAQVILGSVAIEDPEFIKEASRTFPKKIVLGISILDNRVVIRRDASQTPIKPLDHALKFDNENLAAMIITDISRDGALMGVNIDQVSDLAFALTTPIFAAGGVSCMADLQDIKDNEHLGILGVICGRAIYDGKIDPVEALKLMRQDSGRAKLPIDDF